MFRASLAVVCLIFAAAPAIAGGRPTVVELFTSEGCSSCPPADLLLAELARRPELLALSLDVDYWDRLGWKDPYASAAATRRQEAYARLLGLAGVYTTQIVVDGHWQAVGSDRGAVMRALAAAQQTAEAVPLALMLDQGKAQIALGADPGRRPAALFLFGFDRRHVDRVGGGENDGRVLSHVDVVRGFAEIGRTNGAARVLTAPAPWPADRLAAILQQDDGRIIGLATLDRPAS